VLWRLIDFAYVNCVKATSNRVSGGRTSIQRAFSFHEKLRALLNSALWHSLLLDYRRLLSIYIIQCQRLLKIKRREITRESLWWYCYVMKEFWNSEISTRHWLFAKKREIMIYCTKRNGFLRSIKLPSSDNAIHESPNDNPFQKASYFSFL